MTVNEQELNHEWWEAMGNFVLVQGGCGCGMNPKNPLENCAHCRPQLDVMLAIERKLEALR